MKTKIWALALSMTALAATSQAQESTTFGVRAGVNFTNLNGEFDGEDLDFKMKTGFHIGVNAEIPLASEFYLQPGLLFSTKGAKADDDADTKVNLSYLELPINFVYKPTLGTGKLILGVGPYVGYALGGKLKGDGDDVDVEFSNDVDSDDYGDHPLWMKRLDLGGNLLAGYEFANKFSFQLNAGLGLVNLFPKVDGEKIDDYKIKNTTFGVSLGYRF
jgi:hypothetical protein